MVSLGDFVNEFVLLLNFFQVAETQLVSQDSLQGPDLSFRLTQICLSLKFLTDAGRVKLGLQMLQ